MRIMQRMIGAALAVPMTFMATAAFGQQAPEEIVVTGTFGKVPDSVRSLSQPVSYADLDLSTKAGKDEIRRRLNLTARFLCDKLGESGSGGAVTPSCRRAAVADAMKRLGTVEEGFAPRDTTWARPPAWAPPYPPDWATEYP